MTRANSRFLLSLSLPLIWWFNCEV